MKQMIENALPAIVALALTGVAAAAWYFLWSGPAWLFLLFMLFLMTTIFVLAYLAVRDVMEEDGDDNYRCQNDDEPQEGLKP